MARGCEQPDAGLRGQRRHYDPRAGACPWVVVLCVATEQRGLTTET